VYREGYVPLIVSSAFERAESFVVSVASFKKLAVLFIETCAGCADTSRVRDALFGLALGSTKLTFLLSVSVLTEAACDEDLDSLGEALDRTEFCSSPWILLSISSSIDTAASDIGAGLLADDASDVATGFDSCLRTSELDKGANGPPSTGGRLSGSKPFDVPRGFKAGRAAPMGRNGPSETRESGCC